MTASITGDICAVSAVQTAIHDEFFDPLMQRGLLDVHMLVATNGAERTVQQWCAVDFNAFCSPSLPAHVRHALGGAVGKHMLGR